MSRAGSSCAKRIDSSDFLALHLRCHALLGDVALHDVWAVPLPGGGPARTVNQLRAALVGDTRPVANAAVRALFALRWWLGRAFRLDAEHHDPSGASYLHRLTNADRLQSQVSPGTRLGRFRVLYVFDNEALTEIRNATVHAFLAVALIRCESGYVGYAAIYVKPVSRLTPVYMALIDPFRRLLVYPALGRQVQQAWLRTSA